MILTYRTHFLARSTAVAAVGSALVALLLAGCGGSNSSGTETTGTTGGGTKMASTTTKAPGGQKWVIGFSQCNAAEPWRTAMDSALQAEADKHPDQIQVVMKDAQNSSDRQVADVEDLLNRGMNLLVISPNEARPLTPVVQKVFAAKIPVVILDRGIIGDTYTCFIGADNKTIGQMAGEFVAKTLNGKGNVVEIWGKVGSPPAKDRHDGFMAGIAKSPGIKIVATGYGNWLKDDGYNQMKQILQAQSNIDLVYAQNDPMAMGAYLAAQQQNREKGIKFVGIDGLPGPNGGPAEVKAGRLAATFLYPNCGKEAIEYSLKILEGQKVPKKVTLPTATITAANADQYINPK